MARYSFLLKFYLDLDLDFGCSKKMLMDPTLPLRPYPTGESPKVKNTGKSQLFNYTKVTNLLLTSYFLLLILKVKSIGIKLKFN